MADDDHHDHGAPPTHHHDDPASLGVAVLTVSSSRSLEDDDSGDAIQALLEDAGHTVVTRELVRDDFDRVQGIVARLCGRGDVDMVVTTGGTGVTPDDVTPEAILPLLDRELPGFGELFRSRSEAEVGTRAMLSRAVGGVVGDVPVFCLPGSENAARLGVEELIVPEATHLVGMTKRDETEE
ncbi:MAG: molybdenum cofactor biosynthesis protein B [Halobacteriaceae archaeon]